MSRSDTTKGIIGTKFQLRIKMIYRHTITRAEMIFTDKSFMSDVIMCFISVKSLVLWFCILTEFTFGKLFKGNKTGREEFICSKRRLRNNKMGVTDITVSKSKVPFHNEFLGRRQILIFVISDTQIDTGWVNYIIARIICGKIILGVIVNVKHRMA